MYKIKKLCYNPDFKCINENDNVYNYNNINNHSYGLFMQNDRALSTIIGCANMFSFTQTIKGQEKDL